MLFEGVACYERHPWDVRGKVGSERKSASSDTPTVDRILCFVSGFRPRGPPKSMVLVRALGRKNTSIDRRDSARKTVLGCCLRIAIAILCGFRIALPAKQGPGPPRDRDFTEKYTFGVHLRLLIITNHCPFLGAKSRHVPSRLLYAILILCGLRIPFFCASRKSVKIT